MKWTMLPLPDEGLERSALGVDAQRHPLALLVLRDEAVDQLCRRDTRSDQDTGLPCSRK